MPNIFIVTSMRGGTAPAHGTYLDTVVHGCKNCMPETRWFKIDTLFCRLIRFRNKVLCGADGTTETGKLESESKYRQTVASPPFNLTRIFESLAPNLNTTSCLQFTTWIYDFFFDEYMNQFSRAFSLTAIGLDARMWAQHQIVDRTMMGARIHVSRKQIGYWTSSSITASFVLTIHVAFACVSSSLHDSISVPTFFCLALSLSAESNARWC